MIEKLFLVIDRLTGSQYSKWIWAILIYRVQSSLIWQEVSSPQFVLCKRLSVERQLIHRGCYLWILFPYLRSHCFLQYDKYLLGFTLFLSQFLSLYLLCACDEIFKVGFVPSQLTLHFLSELRKIPILLCEDLLDLFNSQLLIKLSWISV